MKTEMSGTQRLLWEEPVSELQADLSIIEQKERKTPLRRKTAKSFVSALAIFNTKGKKVWSGKIDPCVNLEFLLKLSARFGALSVFDMSEGLTLKPSYQAMRKTAAILVEEGRVLYSKSFAERIGIIKKR